MIKIRRVVALLGCIAETSPPVHGQPPLLIFAVGEIGIADGIGSPTRYGLALQLSPLTRWKLSPSFGYSLVENGASYAYADVRRHFALNNRWTLTPSFGLGAFRETRELRLGKELEFRSGIELSYRIENQVRIGFALFHISNGGLAKTNPGTESLVVSLSVPIY